MHVAVPIEGSYTGRMGVVLFMLAPAVVAIRLPLLCRRSAQPSESFLGLARLLAGALGRSGLAGIVARMSLQR
jgi:hypothetical protein